LSGSEIVALLFPPVESAVGADEDQVHAVLRRVRERHGLVVLALDAADVLLARERGVLDALLVHGEEEVACASALRVPGSLARAVHAVVLLIVSDRRVTMPADAALVY
jgi:hypothetical protein